MKGLKSWAAPTALMISVLLASCGAPAASTVQPSPAASTADAAATAAPAGDATASGEQITLRVAWWGAQNRNDRTLEVIKLFEQAHPNIKIAPEYSENKDYWPALSKQVDENNLPDVIQHDYSRIENWVSRDLLLSLNPYVSNGTIDLSEVSDDQIAGGRIGDQLYGVSLGTNAMALIYDPAKFKAAGLEQPTADWTWDEFEQAALTIHQKLGIYGVERFPNMDFFRLYLKENGSWLYNDQNTDLGYEDDAVVERFFQMLLDLQNAGAMTTEQLEKDRGIVSPEKSLVVTGEAAMKFVWSNQAVTISSAAGRDLAIVQTPRIAAGTEGIYLKPSMFFSIASSSKHADAAATFINFFLNSPEANKILAAERGVPITPSVRKAIRGGLEPMQQQVLEYIGEVESVAAPLNPPDPAFHTNLASKAYSATVNQVLDGKLTPKEAAAQMRALALPIIKGQQ